MKIELVKTRCPLCQKWKQYTILYIKNFSLSDLNNKIFSARRLPDKLHYQIVKCKNDGLVRSNPIANHQTLEKLYKKSSFTYQQEIKNLTDTYIYHLKPILKKIKKMDNILEVGCGNGFVLNQLVKLGYKKTYGVEPSHDAIKKSNPKIRKNIKNTILKPSIFQKNMKFKFIFFFQTLDHIPNPNRFLKQCHKLLKRNGYILAFNHNINSFSSKLLKEKSPIIDIEHTFLYNKKTIKVLFEKNHFKTLKVYSPVNKISLKHFFWLLPLPLNLKNKILKSKKCTMKQKLFLKLGNLCIIAQK